MIASGIKNDSPVDWESTRASIRDALFPSNTPRKSTSTWTAENWHLICRYSSILFGKVIDFRRHHSTLGWEFKFELTGRTIESAKQLIQLSDVKVKRCVLQDNLPILLPAQWWGEEIPPTRWGWWVLPVGEDDGLILLKCMERAAADQPIITLPLRGDKSIESALSQMCLTRKHTRWATLLELGYPMRPPRFGEEDVYLPETVMQYLRRRGPLTPTELIPTGQPHLYSRWLKAASHPYDRKPTQLATIKVDEDNLDDREIILDPALLLNYHVSQFKSARKRPASNLAPAPT
eukprot:1530205-Rhodomonas_salina.1